MVDMDFLSALFSGQTGTDDPARAGIAQVPQAEAPLPPPIPGPSPPPIPPPSIPPPSATPPADDSQVSPRVLATLGNARPVQAPGGGDLPVNLIGPQTGPYAALQQVAQNAQGGSQQAATPMQPPAPQPTAAPAATSYGPLMDRILRQIDAREKSGWSDNLLRFGLAAMAAGGKPGATTLGALGEGGLSALSAQDANRGQDLKALLSGAQASNLLSEAGLRQNQLAAVNNLPPIPGSGAAPASGGAGAGPSGTQGPLPPNMTKIASTLSQLGHNPAQIAGALGWATAESGAQDTNTRSLNNTGKDGAAGGSYGWQQWLAERRDQLKDFAKSQSGRVDDPVIQAKFFDQEMRTPGSGAGKAAQSAYWNADSPDQAVVAMAHYGRGEGYSPDNPQGTVGFGKRLAAAQQIYGSIAGSGATQAAAPAAAPNGVMVTASQAMAYGRALEAAGRKEEAGAWFKYADPQFNPSIVGAAETAKQQAKVGPDIAIATAHEQAKVGPQTSINAAHEQSRADREMDVARYRANLETNPNALSYGNPAAGQAGPGITEPLKTPRGTIIPPLAAAAPIAGGTKYLEKRQEQWSKTEDDWSGALTHNKMAEQRALAIADALKKVESGSFETNKAEINAALKAVGIPEFVGKNDPAEVQKILKNNFNAVLDQLKTFSARPTQIEVQLASQNFANPNLQPEANRAIIGQTVGALRWENSLLHDWADAKRVGWRDPQDFQRAWSATNPIQPFVDQAEKDVGTLKGMAVPINEAVRSEANDALRRGVPRDAIVDRLRSRGYDTRGF